MFPSRLLSIGLAAAALGIAPAAAEAATYYASPSGNDNNAGTSTSSPWQTLGRVGRAPLAPGDVVRLQGGATFGGTLSPSRSGSASSPIVYGAYGTGKPTLTGGVYLNSVANLRFEDITVNGAGNGIGSSRSGTGAKSITFRRFETRNNQIGVISANFNDAAWTIEDCVVDRTQDSGMILFAPDTRVQGCKISNTGLAHAALSFSLHAIYAKSARFRAVGNDIWAVADPVGQAISTRYRDTLIEGNYIHDTGAGIGYFRDDSGTGTTTIRRNRFENLRIYALYVGPGNSQAGVGENWHVYNNTAVNATRQNGPAFGWNATGGREFIFRNNAVQNWGAVVKSTSGVTQSHNLLGNFGLETGPAYRTQSASPLVDAGVATIKSGVVLNGDCAENAVSYCGSAPDIGAVETRSTPTPTPTPTVDEAPPVPTGLAATPGNGFVVLDWADSPAKDLDRYEVFRGDATPGSVWAKVTTSTFTNRAGVTNGHQYCYQVRAVDKAGQASARTATVCATPKA